MQLLVHLADDLEGVVHSEVGILSPLISLWPYITESEEMNEGKGIIQRWMRRADLEVTYPCQRQCDLASGVDGSCLAAELGHAAEDADCAVLELGEVWRRDARG